MNRTQAATAIAAILESLDDKHLPKPSSVEETEERTPIVWFDSHGFHLGSTRDGFGAKVGDYRKRGIAQMMQMERVHRLEAAHCAERDAQVSA